MEQQIVGFHGNQQELEVSESNLSHDASIPLLDTQFPPKRYSYYTQAEYVNPFDNKDTCTPKHLKSMNPRGTVPKDVCRPFWCFWCISTRVAICSSISLHSLISPNPARPRLYKGQRVVHKPRKITWQHDTSTLGFHPCRNVGSFKDDLLGYRISSVNTCQIMNSPLMSDHCHLIKEGLAWLDRNIQPK